MSDVPASRGSRQFYTQATSLLGTVTSVRLDDLSFALRCRSGDEFRVRVGPTTWFTALTNMDDLDRDRVRNPQGYNTSRPTESDQVRKYVREGDLLSVEGVEIDHAGIMHFEGRKVTLLAVQPGRFLFEDTHWWLTQIACFADEWLDDLFDDDAPINGTTSPSSIAPI